MSTADYPRIPYGMGSFAQIRRDGLLYIDKTRFVRSLEEHRHAFFIRPRRLGFNIADNLSLEPDFAALLGFTEAEVVGLLEMYRDLGVFDQDMDVALDTMRAWYNGYRYALHATDSVYNTDMVLYYLLRSIPNRPIPEDLIDNNVRIDYGKLRHLMVVSERGAPPLGALHRPRARLPRLGSRRQRGGGSRPRRYGARPLTDSCARGNDGAESVRGSP